MTAQPDIESERADQWHHQAVDRERETAEYSDVPGSKTDGPSAEAAAKITSKAAPLRDACLAILRRGDQTADEVAQALGQSVLSIRPRITKTHRRHQPGRKLAKTNRAQGQRANC